MSNKPSDYLPAYEKETKCICPQCGKIHTKFIFWTGNGIPRKFCLPCRKLIQRGIFSDMSNKLGELK